MKQLKFSFIKWFLLVGVLLAGTVLVFVGWAIYRNQTGSAFATITKLGGQTFHSCPDVSTFTDPRDGNTYRTIQIGTQCWIAENLKYLPTVCPSTTIWDGSAHYYVFDYQGTDVNEAKATTNYRNYGVLYNWKAALESCPTGWHLPTDAEWIALTDFLIKNYKHINISNAGSVLKSCRQVDSPLGGDCNTSKDPRWDACKQIISNTSGIAITRRLLREVIDGKSVCYNTDEFGFSALPGGRCSYGGFYRIGDLCYWWTSTEASPLRVWNRQLTIEGNVNRWDVGKEYGYSVRCVRD